MPTVDRAASILAAASIDWDGDIDQASINAFPPILARTTLGPVEGPLGLTTGGGLFVVLGHRGPRFRPCLMAE